MDEKVTASRYSITPVAQENRKKYDWMHVPGMAGYVNGLVSGMSLSDGGHWARYAATKHVSPMIERRKRDNPAHKISLAAIGCGSARVEAGLIDHGWRYDRILGLEYDSALRKAAAERFDSIKSVDADFEFFDFNNPTPPDVGKFDIIFFCHSIHHATNLETFLPVLNGLLADDGIIIGIDYFGPTRFQVEYEVKEILDDLYAMLPDELKRDLRTDTVPDSLPYPTISHMQNIDISESARSSDLRSMLFSNFPVVEIKPMAGTLLRWLFQFRAGNYDAKNPLHTSIAQLLILIEKSFIESRRIRSDDLFFVLEKSLRL